MAEIRIIIEESGERIDALLARSIDELTRSSATRLIDDGAVTVSGKAIKKNYKVKTGDELCVSIPEVAAECEILAQDIPLCVMFEDDDVIVINKPRGMVVHPAVGHADGTLVNALMHHCGDSLSGVGGEKRPGIVHRIDKDTSGLLIVAKNDFAHLALSAQLADRSLSRVYEAVAFGRFREDERTIDAPIGRHPADRKKMAVTDRNSRNAVTHMQVITRYNGYTHVRCKLETGRTHQIRVHLAHIGHPILGDAVYGHKKSEKGLTGQCLHAKELKFIHPRTGEQVVVSSDLPEYFEQVLKKLGSVM